MSKITSLKKVSTTFEDIKLWYEQNMSPDVINFDDPEPFKVYSDSRWCGVFQLTSVGAQKLFTKARPKSIIDIAALTSVYRPGPLSANVDNLWLKHEFESYDWGHPLINETLKETRGLCVFQESVMSLANKVAGFPLDETDEVRRAIMKRSISGGAAAIQKMKELEDSFVNGCMNNGVPQNTATKAYETICHFSGYGFNKSHAVAYAICSYWCAWLLTYHEEEWVTAYIESMSNSPDKKEKAFGEVKQLGYEIVPIDINHAQIGWTVLPGKKLMPSLLTCKGIGESAAEEVIANRPYENIEQVLWNEDGTWKPSKFNKRGLEALIKVGAFASLDCVGEDKLFESYRHMYEVIIENSNAIKKSSKKDPSIGRKTFFELTRALRPMPEWSRRELVEAYVDVFGSLDVSKLLEQDVLKKLEDKNVMSIDNWEQKGFHWFVVQSVVTKKTKTGKAYLMIKGLGPMGKSYRINVWGWKEENEPLEEFDVIVAELDKNEYGFSTTSWRCKVIA
jgi:DNA polymerase III alpha subunit